jgi:hypothetical protein
LREVAARLSGSVQESQAATKIKKQGIRDQADARIKMLVANNPKALRDKLAAKA